MAAGDLARAVIAAEGLPGTTSTPKRRGDRFSGLTCDDIKRQLTTRAVARDLMAEYDTKVADRGHVMIRDRRTVDLIWQTAQWFVDGHRSGLWILGPVGTGKTTLLRALKDFIRQVNLQTGLEGYRKAVTATYATTRYVMQTAVRNEAEMAKLERCPFLLLDEAGAEAPETMAYGRVLTPVRDLLEERYQWDLPTVVAGNLCDIAGHYGERVHDRCSEMMDKIILDGVSYRELMKGGGL